MNPRSRALTREEPSGGDLDCEDKGRASACRRGRAARTNHRPDGQTATADRGSEGEPETARDRGCDSSQRAPQESRRLGLRGLASRALGQLRKGHIGDWTLWAGAQCSRLRHSPSVPSPASRGLCETGQASRAPHITGTKSPRFTEEETTAQRPSQRPGLVHTAGRRTSDSNPVCWPYILCFSLQENQVAQGLVVILRPHA